MAYRTTLPTMESPSAIFATPSVELHPVLILGDLNPHTVKARLLRTSEVFPYTLPQSGRPGQGRSSYTCSRYRENREYLTPPLYLA